MIVDKVPKRTQRAMSLPAISHLMIEWGLPPKSG